MLLLHVGLHIYIMQYYTDVTVHVYSSQSQQQESIHSKMVQLQLVRSLHTKLFGGCRTVMEQLANINSYKLKISIYTRCSIDRTSAVGIIRRTKAELDAENKMRSLSVTDVLVQHIFSPFHFVRYRIYTLSVSMSEKKW